MFFLALLATFALVGALHAAQPGHGKTLVAGYLVATQGTMRDAVALALHASEQAAAYDRLVGVTLDGRYLIEQVLGVMYVAFLIARLANLYRSRERAD